MHFLQKKLAGRQTCRSGRTSASVTVGCRPVPRQFRSAWHTLHHVLLALRSLRRRRVRISPYKSVQVRIPLPAPCALRNVLCQPEGMCFAFFERHAHGARGEPYFSPCSSPLRPVCCMEACGTQCGSLSYRARTVSRPGGKRYGLVLGATRQPPIFWGLSLHRCAAIPSLGPCALGTEGPRPVC